MILPDRSKLATREQAGPLPTPCHIPIRARGVAVKTTRDGYRMLHFRVMKDGVKLNIHRAAHIAHYRLSVGDVPDGLVLDHVCNNRACCNPDHLNPVTTRENNRKGAASKISREDVEKMKAMRDSGASQSKIAIQFGVSQSHVSRVLRGEFWADGPCPWWQKYKRA